MGHTSKNHLPRLRKDALPRAVSKSANLRKPVMQILCAEDARGYKKKSEDGGEEKTAKKTAAKKTTAKKAPAKKPAAKKTAATKKPAAKKPAGKAKKEG